MSALCQAQHGSIKCAARGKRQRRSHSPQHLCFPLLPSMPSLVLTLQWNSATDLFVSHPVVYIAGVRRERGGVGRAVIWRQYLFTSAKTGVVGERRRGGIESAPSVFLQPSLLRLLLTTPVDDSCGIALAPRELSGSHTHLRMCHQTGTAIPLKQQTYFLFLLLRALSDSYRRKQACLASVWPEIHLSC